MTSNLLFGFLKIDNNVVNTFLQHTDNIYIYNSKISRQNYYSSNCTEKLYVPTHAITSFTFAHCMHNIIKSF